LLNGAGKTTDCINNCCAAPYNSGTPLGWGCACDKAPDNC
jgi:hypothetical protein